MNRILFLVDQKLTVRMFYQEKLSLLGLEVLASSEREHILERIGLDRPDAIIMDIQRWEAIKGDSTCQYELRSMDSGYIVAQRSHAKGLNITLKMLGENGTEHLDVILFKAKMPPRFLSKDKKFKDVELPKGLSFATPKSRPELAMLH